MCALPQGKAGCRLTAQLAERSLLVGFCAWYECFLNSAANSGRWPAVSPYLLNPSHELFRNLPPSLFAQRRRFADRTAAESLRNTILEAERADDERPEDPDEFYDYQLVGLDVVTTAGEAVGIVSEVLHLPAQDVLSVTSGDREILVPFVSAVVPQVDLDARRIVIDPPPGLLDADL